MKPTLFLFLVSHYLFSQTQPGRVTNRCQKFTLQRGILSRLSSFVSTPSKHTRQEREARYGSGRGPDVALTSLLPLLANVHFIKAGSCVSYSVSAGKDSLACRGGFGASSLPALRTSWSHSSFTVPKDNP